MSTPLPSFVRVRTLAIVSVLAVFVAAHPSLAQETTDPSAPEPTPPVAGETEPTDPTPPGDPAPVDPNAVDPAPEKPADTKPVGKTVSDTVGDATKSIDENQTAQETSAGILKFIDDFADHMSFDAFHWTAFALLATGIVSFGLQLVLGKLVVLATGGFSLTAILSDALGLIVSVVGLVLTTQAAADNSDFTKSPAAVLSAAAVGVIAGFLFYLWGQRQEIDAARGRGLRK